MLLWLAIFYYGPQCFPLKPPFDLTPGLLDQAIPFLPDTAWIYQSLFLLLPLAAYLQPNREALLRFATGFCWMVLGFSACFWLWPTQLAEPVSHAGSNWAYQHLVKALDGPRNAFPSLHAALTVYAGTGIVSLYRKQTWVVISILLWSGLLLLSTLTTKQHVLPDLLAGAAVGLVIAVFAIRS